MADGSDQDRRDRDAGNTSSGGGVDIDVDQGARTSMGDITGRDRIEAAGDVHAATRSSSSTGRHRRV